MRRSLVLASDPNSHADELAESWMSWIMLANYDAQESVDEWWLSWGRHHDVMKKADAA